MLTLETGTVLSIDYANMTPNGEVHPIVSVIADSDGSTVPIPLTQAAWGQVAPIPGYRVGYCRQGMTGWRVICFWGNDEEFIRKGENGLNPGDVVFQSPLGFCYLRLAADGSVQLVGGNMDSVIKITDLEVSTKAHNIVLETYDGSSVTLQDGAIHIQKKDKDLTVVSEVTIDSEGNIQATTQKDLTLKAKNIFLDGKVWSGPGASDPVKRATFGGATTSGPEGVYPIDSLGIPVPFSNTVKVAP